MYPVIRLAYNPGPINAYKGILKERESMPPRKQPQTDARSIRLALGAQVVKTVGEKALKQPDGVSVRLALSQGQAEREGNESLCGPTGRLAHKVNNQGDRTLEEGPPHGPTVRLGSCDKGGNVGGENLLRNLTGEDRPALLVSYVYLEPFLKNKHRYHYRDWVLDSGAFSAHNSGTEIKLQDYIDCAKRLIEEDQTLTEVFALDVIGDHKASLKNCEKMWKQGVQAIPTFHYGSPWSELKHIARDYPKIALGGCVGRRDKDKFAGQCFSRVWPKRIHGFGFGSEKSIMALPWHSVDATNWELAPCKYGQWKAFGTQRVSVRGSRQNLRAEVEWYLDLERRARERWKKEMSKLGAVGPAVRLVGNGDVVCDRQHKALGNPVVRLDGEPNSGGVVDGEKRANF